MMCDSMNAVDGEAGNQSDDVISIKTEVIDPEISEKCNSFWLESAAVTFTNAEVVCKVEKTESCGSPVGGNDSNMETVQLDKKESVEPVKSSNEILSELFGIFNVTLPEELQNDANLLRKMHQESQETEKLEESKNLKVGDRCKTENIYTNDTRSDGNGDGNGNGNKNKHEKRNNNKVQMSMFKHKKNDKHPSFKNKRNYRHYSNVTDEESLHTEHDERTTQRLSKTTATNSNCGNDRKHNSFYNAFEESKEKRIKRSHFNSCSPIRTQNKTNHQKQGTEALSTVNKNQISDLSLSGEQHYMNYNIASDNGKRSRNKRRSIYAQRYHWRHSYSKGSAWKSSRVRQRQRYCRTYRLHSYRRSISRSRSPSRSYSRSHSRSPSRSRALGIDKKRLLEIARKNAIKFVNHENDPLHNEMPVDIKDNPLVKMRYGGGTVKDITDFCKKLSNEENLDIPDISSEEESDVDNSGKLKLYNHPFAVKKPENIVMNIRGSAPNSSNKQPGIKEKTINMKFPISSGQNHRFSEIWRPVVKTKESLALFPSLPLFSQSTALFKKAAAKNAVEKAAPVQTEEETAVKALNILKCNVMDKSEATPPTTESNLNTAPLNVSALSTSWTASIASPVAAQPAPVLPTKHFYPHVPLRSAAPTTTEPNMNTAPLNVSALSTSWTASIASPVAAQPVPVLPTTPFYPHVSVRSAAPSISVLPELPTSNIPRHPDISSILFNPLNPIPRVQDNLMNTAIPPNPNLINPLNNMCNLQNQMSPWLTLNQMPVQFTNNTGEFTNNTVQFTNNTGKFTNNTAQFTNNTVQFTNNTGKFTNNTAQFTNNTAQFTNNTGKFTNNTAQFTNNTAQFTNNTAQFTNTLSAPGLNSGPYKWPQRDQFSSIVPGGMGIRLPGNVMNRGPLNNMCNLQQQMPPWLSLNKMPGQLTNIPCTNTLSAPAFNPGPQARTWGNQCTLTVPMAGGMGTQIHQKMCWKPSEGLGRGINGALHPLVPNVKPDKRGLVTEEDNVYRANQGPPKKRPTVNLLKFPQDTEDKHPVCLLNELTSKRKWAPAQYTLIDERGPSHNKMFLYSVLINGQIFTPPELSNTKKYAKFKAARFCLQQMGFIP